MLTPGKSSKRTDKEKLVIQIRNLSFNYPGGDKVLKGINLEIAKGEYVADCRGKWCGQDHPLSVPEWINPNVVGEKISGR